MILEVRIWGPQYFLILWAFQDSSKPHQIGHWFVCFFLPSDGISLTRSHLMQPYLLSMLFELISWYLLVFFLGRDCRIFLGLKNNGETQIGKAISCTCICLWWCVPYIKQVSILSWPITLRSMCIYLFTQLHPLNQYCHRSWANTWKQYPRSVVLKFVCKLEPSGDL